MNESIDELRMMINRQIKENNLIYCNIAAASGLSECAFWILYIASDGGKDYSQREVSDILCMSKTTVHSAIKLLCQKGFVNLERAPDSGKRKFIRLTSSGVNFITQYILPLRNAEASAILQLSSDERSLFLEILKKYNEDLCMRTASLREGVF